MRLACSLTFALRHAVADYHMGNSGLCPGRWRFGALEKEREQGQKIIDTYISDQISKSCARFSTFPNDRFGFLEMSRFVELDLIRFAKAFKINISLVLIIFHSDVFCLLFMK